MKVRKFNEKLNVDEPKLGDYTICIYSSNGKVNKIISSKIGKIINIDYNSNFPYDIRYDELPMDRTITRYFNNKDSHSFIFKIDEILYFSENKEDLEPMLQAKKFNL